MLKQKSIFRSTENTGKISLIAIKTSRRGKKSKSLADLGGDRKMQIGSTRVDPMDLRVDPMTAGLRPSVILFLLL